MQEQLGDAFVVAPHCFQPTVGSHIRIPYKGISGECFLLSLPVLCQLVLLLVAGVLSTALASGPVCVSAAVLLDST